MEMILGVLVGIPWTPKVRRTYKSKIVFFTWPLKTLVSQTKDKTKFICWAIGVTNPSNIVLFLANQIPIMKETQAALQEKFSWELNNHFKLETKYYWNVLVKSIKIWNISPIWDQRFFAKEQCKKQVINMFHWITVKNRARNYMKTQAK